MPNATAAITMYVKASRRKTRASPCACTSTPPIAAPTGDAAAIRACWAETSWPIRSSPTARASTQVQVGLATAKPSCRAMTSAWVAGSESASARPMHAAICTTLASGIIKLAPARSRARAISWVQVW